MRNLVFILAIGFMTIPCFGAASTQLRPSGLYQGYCKPTSPDVDSIAFLLKFEEKNGMFKISGAVDTQYKNGQRLAGTILDLYKIESDGRLSAGYTRGTLVSKTSGQCGKSYCYVAQTLTSNSTVLDHSVSFYRFKDRTLNYLSTHIVSNGKVVKDVTECTLNRKPRT